MSNSQSLADDLRADYIRRLERGLARLPIGLAADLRIELVTHLDQLASAGSDPVVSMRSAIERLGDPDDFLAELAADEAVRRAAGARAPGAILRSLARRTALGGSKGLLAAAMLVAFAFAAAMILMGLLWPFFPDHVGLLEFADGRLTFGIAGEPARRELLGLWRLPIGLMGGLLLWLLLRGMTRRIWA